MTKSWAQDSQLRVPALPTALLCPTPWDTPLLLAWTPGQPHPLAPAPCLLLPFAKLGCQLLSVATPSSDMIRSGATGAPSCQLNARKMSPPP